MTAAQRSYLKTLCEEAHEPMDETLTKAQASERTEALQQQTGRSTAPGPQRKESSIMHATAKDVLTPDVVRVTEDMEVRTVAQQPGHEAITGYDAQKGSPTRLNTGSVTGV